MCSRSRYLRIGSRLKACFWLDDDARITPAVVRWYNVFGLLMFCNPVVIIMTLNGCVECNEMLWAAVSGQQLPGQLPPTTIPTKDNRHPKQLSPWQLPPSIMRFTHHQGRMQGEGLGLTPPLELDILQKFYYLRKEINCFYMLFAC